MVYSEMLVSPFHSHSGVFEPLVSTLVYKDFYIVGKDFSAYIEANKKVDAAYLKKQEWAKRSILASAGMGKFSSDRSIVEYAEKIWKCKPVVVPDEARDF